MKDSTSTKNVLNFLSYASLIIVALLIFIGKFLPIIGVDVNGPLFGLLNTIKEIFVIIVIGFNAYRFVTGKAKWVKVLFWIAVALFVAGIVMDIIGWI